MRKQASGEPVPARAKAAIHGGKHVGDVLGIGRAPKHGHRAAKDRGGNPKGIELGGRRRTLKGMRVVGGVRGRGR